MPNRFQWSGLYAGLMSNRPFISEHLLPDACRNSKRRSLSVYRERFGEGLIIPANKTKLKMAYQPGWPMHLEPEISTNFLGFPMSLHSAHHSKRLRPGRKSTEMIDGYSRYLGRNTIKAGTLEALLNLPLRSGHSAESDRWQAFLTSVVDPMEPVILETMLRELGYVGIWCCKNHRDSHEPQPCSIGFEPDILAGSRRQSLRNGRPLSSHIRTQLGSNHK